MARHRTPPDWWLVWTFSAAKQMHESDWLDRDVAEVEASCVSLRHNSSALYWMNFYVRLKPSQINILIPDWRHCRRSVYAQLVYMNWQLTEECSVSVVLSSLYCGLEISRLEMSHHLTLGCSCLALSIVEGFQQCLSAAGFACLDQILINV